MRPLAIEGGASMTTGASVSGTGIATATASGTIGGSSPGASSIAPATAPVTSGDAPATCAAAPVIITMASRTA